MKTLTIARREMAGTFFSPLAYIVGALFLCVCAFKFIPPPEGLVSGSRESFIFVPAQQASLRPLFEMMALAMVVAAPLLTMRLLSEEVRSGTVETLMTAPVTDANVVIGKFLGVMAFYVMLLAGTAVFLVLMILFAQVDAPVVILSYLGMILLGATFLSVGVFASTLTRYQLLAAILSMTILSIFAVAMGQLAPHLPPPWNTMATRLDAMAYLRKFTRGLLDTRGIVFFLTLTAGFLFLSVKQLESRRWR